MKKQLFTIACLIFSMTILAQDETRKFTPSIKIGVGMWTEELLVMDLELGVQAEYKASDWFSIYGNISYSRLFEITDISYGINHMNFLAGPRLYLSKSFFTGVGAGYLLFFDDGYSEGGFAISPHIGFDRPKTQWTLNYTATTDGGVYGYISLAAAFKLGTKKTPK